MPAKEYPAKKKKGGDPLLLLSFNVGSKRTHGKIHGKRARQEWAQRRKPSQHNASVQSS